MCCVEVEPLRRSTRGPLRGDLPVIQYDTTPIPIIPEASYEIVLPQEQKDQIAIYGEKYENPASLKQIVSH